MAAQRLLAGDLLRRVAADGAVLAQRTLAVEVEARSVALLPLPPEVAELADPKREFLVADADGLRALHFGCTDADFDYPAADLAVELVPLPEGAAVTVTARTLLRDLLLQADRLDPGATTDRGLTLPGALRCVNSCRWAPQT